MYIVIIELYHNALMIQRMASVITDNSKTHTWFALIEEIDLNGLPMLFFND